MLTNKVHELMTRDPITATVSSTIFEVMELNDSSRGMAELVASAADRWDRVTDPVRSLLP